VTDPHASNCFDSRTLSESGYGFDRQISFIFASFQDRRDPVAREAAFLYFCLLAMIILPETPIVTRSVLGKADEAAYERTCADYEKLRQRRYYPQLR
jgi:hypothetical protein